MPLERSGKAARALDCREPGDRPSARRRVQTPAGVCGWMCLKPLSGLRPSLAPARNEARARVKSILNAVLNDASADHPAGHRRSLIGIYGLLGAMNLAIWVWAFIALADRPALLGTAFLAYVLGLRHAVDADHIATIDNVVRKLMQEGKRP